MSADNATDGGSSPAQRSSDAVPPPDAGRLSAEMVEHMAAVSRNTKGILFAIWILITIFFIDFFVNSGMDK